MLREKYYLEIDDCSKQLISIYKLKLLDLVFLFIAFFWIKSYLPNIQTMVDKGDR